MQTKLSEVIQSINSIDPIRLEYIWAGLDKIEETHRDWLMSSDSDNYTRIKKFEIWNKTINSWNQKIGNEIKHLDKPELFVWLKNFLFLTNRNKWKNVRMFLYVKTYIEGCS